ncbi:MAG: GrdX family protein [Lagierella massiliensis]|nr:GrdX family protein [Lagierella massiliensis]
MLIITNNPKFIGLKRQDCEIRYLEEDYLSVLKAARDLVHTGYEVLTHPLYGSVKPYETVYRTIVLKEGDKTDFNSVQLLENAIETAEKFYKMNKHFKWTADILDDFQVIDKDLIDNALERI